VGFSSPEEALVALEQAYRDGDVDAAVRAKNFAFEGAAMIQKLGQLVDADLARQAAHVLELSYRKHARDDGLPDFSGLTTSILSQAEVEPDLVLITERIEWADGRVAEEGVHAARTDGRWGIVTISP
jgi:hypothetical protein